MIKENTDLKNIAVVADNKFRDIAIGLVHAISEKPDLKASYYNLKQWKDDEVKIAASNHVIFIGRNDASEPYLSLLKKKNEKLGVAWGYFGVIAAIYIEKINLDIKEIKKEMKKIKELKLSLNKNRRKKIALAFAEFSFALLVPMGLLIIALSEGWVRLSRKHKTEIAEKYLYHLGITSFLHEQFDEFIKD
ncbi:MAG: hypothetical protein NT056_05205 [Proteobacteria bacterium]|nr:hypothetical protein [Pseudomonadota bacterium]